MEIDDSQLLRDYVTSRSQHAFGELVNRHINLVYAAARRQVRDAHLAEDVAQAVFIIFARKAASVRSGAVLPAWLLSTTRFAASNALSLETRRRKHEQKAAELAPAAQEPSESVMHDDDLTPTLDEALHRLDDKDRSAVAMRFFEGKSLRDVGASMGISEEAAQKRVMRAVDKLRQFFARRGVTMPSQSLLDGLARQSAAIAPAALGPMIASNALSAGSATATSAAALIAKGAAQSMVVAQTKVAALVMAVVVAVGTTSTVVIIKNRAAAPANAPSVATAAAPSAAASPLWQPAQISAVSAIGTVSFQNTLMMPTLPSNTTDFSIGMDEKVQRRPGEATGHIASIVPAPTGFAARGFVIPAHPYRGKRVRLVGMIKTEGVQQFAGVQLAINADGVRSLRADAIGTPLISGTSDWTESQAVGDVPAEADAIQFAVALYGKGKMWMDDLHLDVVPDTVATTTDERWHDFSPAGELYDAVLDPAAQRNGHATVCLSSSTATGNQFGAYTRVERVDVARYRGKKIRMTAMIKCEKVTARGGLFINTWGMLAPLTNEGQRGKRPVQGTLGWVRYTATAIVPEEAMAIETGVMINGSGKIWIDDVKYEVVDEPTTR